MTIELLQQVRLLDPIAMVDQVVDVLIEDGVIQAIESHINEIPSNAQIYASQGLVLGSGLVDLYSHSGEPGFEERETLESLSQAAISGGFTRLNILPDTEPAIDNPAAVTWFRQNSKLSCWGALTLHANGQHMTELSELAQSGVVGFADGQPIANLVLVRRLLEYLQPLKKPVALWACDRS